MEMMDQNTLMWIVIAIGIGILIYNKVTEKKNKKK